MIAFDHETRIVVTFATRVDVIVFEYDIFSNSM